MESKTSKATRARKEKPEAVNPINQSKKGENMEKFYSFVRDEKGRLQDITIHGIEGGDVQVIRPQTYDDFEDVKSVLRAASSYFKFHDWDHPSTTPTLHIRKAMPSLATLKRASDIGYVSVGYDGDLPIPTPHLEEYPGGWAVVNKRNGRFFLTPIADKKDEDANRLHDFIQGMEEGDTFELRVLPVAPYAEAILATYEEEDLEKAAEMRKAGIRRAVARDYLEAPIQKAKRQGNPIQANSPVADKTTGEIRASFVMATVKGKTVDIATLPIPTRLKLHIGNKETVAIKWDGTAYAKTRVLQAIDAGWPVELP